jgi:flagellar basal-body rod modification protein FlgD
MSQLAQFSSLEQMTNMSETMTSLATTSAVTQGVDLIGRNIGYTRADGSTGSGVADSVSISDGGAVIGVGSDKVDPSEITSVGLAPTSSQTQSTPTS